MTKKPQPDEPTHAATQENSTIALESEALADAVSSASDVGYETVQLEAVAAPGAAEVLQAPTVENRGVVAASRLEEPGSTRPRVPVVSAPDTGVVPQVATGDPSVTTHLPVVDLVTEADDGIVDEVDPEWTVADQPTVQLTPSKLKPPRPAYLETGEQEVWPPRPTPTPAPVSQPSQPLGRTYVSPGREPTPIPRPPTFTRPTLRPPTPPGRIPSPTGKLLARPTAAAYSDPRMRRLAALRQQREAVSDGKRAPGDYAPVAQVVRQWWSDLLPGLSDALNHQHEARASGVHPIPAHEPSPVASLGDAFGRLAAVVRDIGEKAQSAAKPALNRLHDRTEHVAQALVDRLEGPAVRQQAPLLGPGRVAVFFRQGVTVGQAQRVLTTNQVRPMRLIPRRHGFLGMVQPGYESDVGEQLRQHPYVRDVVYLRYDANGEPLSTR
jgi:hypothetical protein